MRTMIHRLGAVIALAILGVLSLPASALAADDTTEIVGDGDVLSINALTLAVIVGVIVPIINGIVLKPTVHAAVKGVVNLVLTYVGNAIALATQEDGSAVFSREVVVTTALAFAVALATYAGVYKPLGITNNPANPTASVPGRNDGRTILGKGGIG